MNEERRRFKRIPAELNAQCMLYKNDEPAMTTPQHFLCRTKDLSLRGTRLLVSDNVNVDRHLPISLEVPNPFKPLLIKGDVIWVREPDESNHNSSGEVQFGVKFSRIGSYEEKELRKCLGLKVNQKFSLAEMLARFPIQASCVGMSVWLPPAYFLMRDVEQSCSSWFLNTDADIKKNIDKESAVI